MLFGTEDAVVCNKNVDSGFKYWCLSRLKLVLCKYIWLLVIAGWKEYIFSETGVMIFRPYSFIVNQPAFQGINTTLHIDQFNI